MGKEGISLVVMMATAMAITDEEVDKLPANNSPSLIRTKEDYDWITFIKQADVESVYHVRDKTGNTTTEEAKGDRMTNNIEAKSSACYLYIE